MIRRDLPADPRVNVIGSVPENAHRMMENSRRGQKFTLVRMDG
jgi:hypothetical protein